MEVSDFYSRVFEILEKNPNSTLERIILNQIDQKLLDEKILHNSYTKKDISTVDILNPLISKLLDFWEISGKEHSKILSYYNNDYRESELIYSLVPFIYNEIPKSSLRMHEVLRALVEDDYISKTDIFPPLEDTYPHELDCILNYEKIEFGFRFSNRIPKYNITENIHNKIQSKFIGDKNSQREVKKFENDFYELDIDKLEELVMENVKYANRPEIPIEGFGAVLRVTPDDFVNKHLFNLALKFNLQFPQMYPTEEMLEHAGNKFVVGKFNPQKDDTDFNCAIAIHPNHTIIITNPPNDFEYDQKIGLRLFASKLAIEDYCKSRGVATYTETIVSNTNKEIIREKVNTMRYLKDNLERISSAFDENTIPEIISFANHHFAFKAEIKKTYKCSCQENVVDGKFSFNPDGKFMKDLPILSRKITFPLSNLHNISKHPESYMPKINEPQIIEELIKLTKNYQVFKLPDGLENEYVNVMKTITKVNTIDMELLEYYWAAHGIGDNKQEELITHKEKLLAIVSDNIKKIIKRIETEQGALPAKYTPGPYISRIYDDMNFLEALYNSYKIENLLNPTPQATAAINEIEEEKRLIEKEKQNKRRLNK